MPNDSQPPSDPADSELVELHEAAKNFNCEYHKPPGRSGFKQWSAACERLETAAVRYAKSLSPQNDALCRPAGDAGGAQKELSK